jgi:hypothetical protein
MKEIDTTTILMTTRIMEIAASIRNKEARAAGTKYDEREPVDQDKYIDAAAVIFLDQIKRVQRAVEAAQS